MGEASDRGINVPDRAVQEAYRQIRQTQFRREDAYQRFLERSGFSDSQVRDRVQLQVISERLEIRVRDSGQELGDYVRRYNKKWRSRTLCAPSYLVERCRNDAAETKG
jgi:hypothetical protein